MTADEALSLAKFQRPGVRLIVGPTEAREVAVEPMNKYSFFMLPGEDVTWFGRYLRLKLGFMPSVWAMDFGFKYRFVTGDFPTDAEWQWLHGTASLADANAWIDMAIERFNVGEIVSQLPIFTK